MPTRSRRRRTLTAAASAAAVLVSSAPAATSPPTGDRAAIRFYTAQANAYAALPGVKIVETGFFYLHKNAGTSVSYAWGNGPQPGYTPATGTILVQLANGHIAAYLATLQAPKIRRLRVLMSAGAVFTSTTRCWRRSTPAGSPLGVGDSYVFNDGGARFLPLAHEGGSTAVTMSYRWAPGATATEVNRFAHGRPAPVSVTVDVRGSRSMSFHKTITPLHKAPALPVQPPPVIPRPTPMCK
ncbi:MAG TPA: hypothetical protein VFA19_14015 [Gaiellaceae bacterium]|nr:hypothetical protein [Gaiellaceae bacterium]